jgi:hypothetical protein
MGSPTRVEQRLLHNLKMKSTVDAQNHPEFVGFAPAGAADSDKLWQLTKLAHNATSGDLISREYAQDGSGEESNEFKFSWVATPSTTEIKINGLIISGNTLTIDIDGRTVSQAFTVDHVTTVAAWAALIQAENPVAQVQTLTTDADLITGNTYNTDIDGVTINTAFSVNNDTTLANHASSIASQPGVATAVVTDAGANDREIVITAATAGTPVTIANFNVTGGASQAGVVRATTTANGVGISTATVRAPNSDVIVVVSETSPVAAVYANEAVTGTTINSTVSVRETVAHQGAPSTLTYGT